MKLFDAFDKSGGKIGEIHDTREDDFGCAFGVIIALIVIIGGALIWLALFKTTVAIGVPPSMWIYFAVLFVTDILICLVRRKQYCLDSFGETFAGMLTASTLIVSIIICCVCGAGMWEDFSFADGAAIVFATLLFQVVPSLVMTIIVKMKK